MPTFVGVKNKTKTVQYLQHDNAVTEFGPEEVKILESVLGQHADTRVVVGHAKDNNGKPLLHLEGKKLFEIIPLAEALKVAKLIEDPGIEAARRKIEEDAKKEAELLARLKESLKSEGWKPPKNKEDK